MVAPLGTIHADPQQEKVAEQEHDKMHAPIIGELAAEILAAAICLGDLHCIEWLLKGLLDLAELICNLGWLRHVTELSMMGRIFDNISHARQGGNHDGHLLRKGEIEASSGLGYGTKAA